MHCIFKWIAAGKRFPPPSPRAPEPRRLEDNSFPSFRAEEKSFLSQGSQEFHPEQAQVSGRLLAQNPRGNRRSLAGHHAGRGRRWCGEGQMHRMIEAQDVRGRYAGPRSADIQCFREFDELHPGGIHAAKQNGHLELDSLCSTSFAGDQEVPFPRGDISFQAGAIGTRALVPYPRIFMARTTPDYLDITSLNSACYGLSLAGNFAAGY